MNLHDVLQDAKSYLADTGLEDGFRVCGVRSVGVAQTRRPKRTSCSVVEPLIGLVLQGGKSVQFGTEKAHYKAGDIIVIGQALPMMSGLVEATPQEPYIAIYIGLDMPTLRGVYSDLGGAASDDTGLALTTATAGAEVIDAIGRLFRLREDPIAEQVLGQALLREVYFRVLCSDSGHALRRIIHTDSKANQIAKAIAHIRKEYRSTIRASDLAAMSGMSATVFYDNFKRVTANSPLQFQKDLRLTEAHQMLVQTDAPVSEIAHKVGYESAAQFSREFSKKFGASPRSFVEYSAA